MKTCFQLLLVAFMIVGLCACSHYSAMSYNIRLDLAADGENAWNHRKQAVLEQVRSTQPDFLGVQEARPNQMEDMTAALPNYRYIGIGRDGAKVGEFSAIFYNAKQWNNETETTFWLSDTPGIKSIGWDAAFPRICTYGLFTHRTTGKKLWVFNTHLDHMGNEARRNSLPLIKNRINDVNPAGHPVILMGDMNAEPEDAIFSAIAPDFVDTRTLSNKPPSGPMATFNGFNKDETPSRRIDYIFVSNPDQFKIKAYSVLSPRKAEPFPSDHFPVMIDFNLR